MISDHMTSLGTVCQSAVVQDGEDFDFKYGKASVKLLGRLALASFGDSPAVIPPLVESTLGALVSGLSHKVLLTFTSTSEIRRSLTLFMRFACTGDCSAVFLRQVPRSALAEAATRHGHRGPARGARRLRFASGSERHWYQRQCMAWWMSSCRRVDAASTRAWIVSENICSSCSSRKLTRVAPQKKC